MKRGDHEPVALFSGRGDHGRALSASHPSLARTDHRPWPLPAKPWEWRQSWRKLAFLHYPLEAALLRPLLPRGLQLQEFGGSAWLGVVPFLMDDVMRGSLPAVPGFSRFPELNVRTYVEYRGQPGVWFFSLDASSLAFVFGGRCIYKLPYHLARMRLAEDSDGSYEYFSIRLRSGGRTGFEARYRPTGDAFTAAPGTFEHWATERYCLYSHTPRQGLTQVDVHHLPWPLQNAEVEIRRNDLITALGLPMPEAPPVCHFSSGVEVISWSGVRLPAAAV